MAMIAPVAGYSPARARAGTLPLEISEINWAGSASHPEDTWIEFFNTSTTAIDFTVTPYHLFVDGVSVVNLTTGMLAGQHLYLVTSLPGGHPATSLNVTPDLPVTLPPLTATSKFELKDSGNILIDQAVFAAGTTVANASMIRQDFTIAGDQPGAWAPAHSIGQNFKATVGVYPNPAQLGSPEVSTTVLADPTHPNPDVDLPSNLTIDLPSPATTSNTLTVSGDVTATITSVDAQFRNPVSGVVTKNFPGLVPVSNKFTATVNPGDLPVGTYQLFATARDAQGNRSREVFGLSYTINGAGTVLNAPKIDPFPTYINNALQVTLTGTVDSGTVLLIYVNGAIAGYNNIGASVTTFRQVVPLVANTVNHIELRARDAAGNTSAPAPATIIHDNITPVITAHVTSNPPGTNDTISGTVADANIDNTSVVEIRDSANPATLIASTTLTAGAFGPVSLGDNKYANVFVKVTDLAGNIGQTGALSNPIVFTGSPSVNFTGIQTTQVTMNWLPVTGAATYIFRYMPVGGTFSQKIDLCPTGITTCTLSRPIPNLTPSTSYVFAISAVDAFGNIGPETTSTVRTADLPVVITTVSSTPTPEPTVAPTPVPTPTPKTDVIVKTTPTPVPTVAPTSTATPDTTGDVKSAQDTAAAHNYTPYIILAVLIVLAILATTGYFYWFGGEAGDEVMASVQQDMPEEDASPPPTTTKSSSTRTAKKDPGEKPKRW